MIRCGFDCYRNPNDHCSRFRLQISFVLKLLDCFAIGIMTLKFIVDITEAWWVTCLKVFGWMFVFPMLIFTPMLGVARYVAIPVGGIYTDSYTTQ